MLYSKNLFSQAQQVMPGGVNSPVRAFNAVGGVPVFFKSGSGAYLVDEDRKSYIDYVGSWGPMILGHAHPAVISALQQAIKQGLSFGAPTELEVKLAEKICSLMPSIEQIRMVNSGTEATMSAIRLARAATKRDKIIKFIGCYHGHNDALLVSSGSGALTFGTPSSQGVPKSFIEHTLLADFNCVNSVETLFARFKDQIAAIIVEPIAGNMGCIPPIPGFLECLRTLCNQHKSLLIFDEVITGFRVALGGAQSYYKVTPDLTTLGKIIGGGMPVGAFGGKREIMRLLAPEGPVYQAGTLSGNPIAMTAGLTTINEIIKCDPYQKLEALTTQLTTSLLNNAKEENVSLVINQVGSLFSLFFTDNSSVSNYEQVMQSDVEMFKIFFHSMLNQGIYFAPSAFESAFISLAHQQAEIDATIKAAKTAFKLIKGNQLLKETNVR